MDVDIGKEKVEILDGKIILSGTVKPPLSWHYSITMDGNDWIEFFEIAFHPTIISYLIEHRKWKVLISSGINLLLFLIKYTLTSIKAHVRALFRRIFRGKNTRQ